MEHLIDMEKVIKGLEFTKAMITFNPSTGEDIEPEDLNEDNKITYDACVGAIALLKEQEAEIEQLNRFINGFSRDAMPIVRCKDCKWWGAERLCENSDSPCFQNGCTHGNWFCADGERK